MSLTRDQRIALELAGTVCVPSPFPAAGEIRIVTEAEPDGKVSMADLLARKAVCLEVRHRISPKLSITRIVYLDEVAAVFLPDHPEGDRHDVGSWLLALELQAECFNRVSLRPARRGGEDRRLLGKGVVYLPESAKVLMRVEVGMTAAESVEYYPPLAGERGKEYHDLCTVRRKDYE